jgi:hypothetical protein
LSGLFFASNSFRISLVSVDGRQRRSIPCFNHKNVLRKSIAQLNRENHKRDFQFMSEQEPTKSKVKTGADLSPKGSKKKTKSKQLITLLGGLNEAAINRIIKDFKKHPLKMTPLEAMLDIAASVNIKPHLRLAAAKEAAQYMHKKMPSFTNDQEGGANTQAPTVVVINEVKNENQELRKELEAELEAAIAQTSKTRKE